MPYSSTSWFLRRKVRMVAAYLQEDYEAWQDARHKPALNECSLSPLSSSTPSLPRDRVIFLLSCKLFEIRVSVYFSSPNTSGNIYWINLRIKIWVCPLSKDTSVKDDNRKLEEHCKPALLEKNKNHSMYKKWWRLFFFFFFFLQRGRRGNHL